MMAAGGGAFGNPAPATAYFQHRRARFAEFAENAAIFFLLRFFQRVRRAIERRGIGHAAVQPQPVKFVADVVMRLNIARRTGNGIASHQRIVDHEKKTVQKIAVGEIFQFVQIEKEQADEGLDIVGLPTARDIFRSEEHTSELQSHSFISYAVFCLKKSNIFRLISRGHESRETLSSAPCPLYA